MLVIMKVLFKYYYIDGSMVVIVRYGDFYVKPGWLHVIAYTVKFSKKVPSLPQYVYIWHPEQLLCYHKGHP